MRKPVLMFLAMVVAGAALASCSKREYCASYSSGTYNKHFKSTLPHYGNKK